jgi:Flp pilus assembly pilin Flp
MGKFHSCNSKTLAELHCGLKGATMLECALLVCLLCLVAVPAIANVGGNANGTFTEVAGSIEGPGGLQPLELSGGGGAFDLMGSGSAPMGGEGNDDGVISGPLSSGGADSLAADAQGQVEDIWNGGPIPFAKGNGWHAVDINEKLVVPVYAHANYQIYTVYTTGPARGSYYMNYFTQSQATGQWTQHPPGVNPNYQSLPVAGSGGEWISFYSFVSELE